MRSLGCLRELSEALEASKKIRASSFWHHLSQPEAMYGFRRCRRANLSLEYRGVVANGWMAGWWMVRSVLELDKNEYVSQ